MAEGQLTFEQARDAILTRFREQLLDDYGAIMDTDEDAVVYWDNLSSNGQPPQDKPWFRVVVRHTDSDQSSLGEANNRRFNRVGLVSVQVFTPAGARGLTLADQLGKMAVDAFEGKEADGVWFRNVRLQEIGPDGPWFQYNVTASFTYDQTK